MDTLHPESVKADSGICQNLETALKKTILAGSDIIIFGYNLVYDEDVAGKARDIILDLVRQGKIPASNIRASYQRIMDLKEKIAGQHPGIRE